MERKTLLLILSTLLLTSFFVPYIQWEDFTMSGFDFVVSTLTPGIKYILLAVPGCALILLLSLFSDNNTIMHSKLLLKAPFVVLGSLLAIFYLNAGSNVIPGGINPLNVFCTGLWIALAVSVVMVGLKKRKLTR